MNDPKPLSMGDLLAVLRNHGVEFLVIGGAAVIVHGFPRATKDLDVVPRQDMANLERLAEALHSIDAEILESHDFDPDEMPARLDAAGLAMGGNWCLATEFGRIDVLQYVDGVMETDDAIEAMIERAIEADINGMTVAVASLEDLLAFKRRAGREQDLIDIRAVLEANGLDTAP